MILFYIISLMNPSIVRLRYSGGDWYNDPDIIPNLAAEINTKTDIEISKKEVILSLNDSEIYSYPFLFITGHGQTNLSKSELENLRNYLWNGGFIYVDDDYGMDEHFREQLNNAFPKHKLVASVTEISVSEMAPFPAKLFSSNFIRAVANPFFIALGTGLSLPFLSSPYLFR